MEVTILAGAESDLWTAWVHYESLNPGLGAKFDEAVLSSLQRLARFPASAPLFAGEFRRLLLLRFDHGIFYRIHGSRLVVAAVIDLRKNPEEIRRRLGISDVG